MGSTRVVWGSTVCRHSPRCSTTVPRPDAQAKKKYLRYRTSNDLNTKQGLLLEITSGGELIIVDVQIDALVRSGMPWMGWVL
jgi:hypothetical protein